MAARTDLGFEEFVEFQFSRPVPAHGWPWYHELDCEWWEPEPRSGIAYLTRLFSDGPTLLDWFSDAQIAQGIDGLCNTMAVGDQPWMRDPVTPASQRAAAWHAVGEFYANMLAPRCEPMLAHCATEMPPPLNGLAYMWWESFPGFTNPDDPEREIIDQAELACLERILTLGSIACQEGALHGLGHWVRREPRCEAIIDRYLSSNRAAHPELINYAKAARCGCVL